MDKIDTPENPLGMLTIQNKKAGGSVRVGERMHRSRSPHHLVREDGPTVKVGYHETPC